MGNGTVARWQEVASTRCVFCDNTKHVTCVCVCVFVISSGVRSLAACVYFLELVSLEIPHGKPQTQFTALSCSSSSPCPKIRVARRRCVIVDALLLLPFIARIQHPHKRSIVNTSSVSFGLGCPAPAASARKRILVSWACVVCSCVEFSLATYF